jgi:hypothetical protein
MATTTNYGWDTPDDTDLVKDGAAAIRTLGTSIDTSFAADEGDLLVGGTSDIFEALPIGAAGTVLTSDGDTAAWTAPAGGGKLLQVVSATTSTQTVISTTSFTDTTLTATITPSSATSKIYVIYSQQYRYDYYAGGDQASGLKLIRASTTIQSYGATNRLGAAGSQLQSALGGGSVRVVVGGNFLDSPATTSATTYKIQLAPYTVSNSGAIIANEDAGSISVITLMEIGA